MEKIKNIQVLNSKEVIIVDDFSNDNSLKLVEDYKGLKNILILKHNKNLGKGAAIKTAQKHVNGEIVIIQDADLEYDPNDYSRLINPILTEI